MQGNLNKDCGDGSLGAGIPWSTSQPLPVDLVSVEKVQVVVVGDGGKTTQTSILSTNTAAGDWTTIVSTITQG